MKCCFCWRRLPDEAPFQHCSPRPVLLDTQAWPSSTAHKIACSTRAHPSVVDPDNPLAPRNWEDATNSRYLFNAFGI